MSVGTVCVPVVVATGVVGTDVGVLGGVVGVSEGTGVLLGTGVSVGGMTLGVTTTVGVFGGAVGVGSGVLQVPT